MGKRKQISNHAPSQEEIWDDSALIRSWDEAVAEYEFYHSIAARGEDVEEVLRLAKLEEEDGAVTNLNGMKGTKVVADSSSEPPVDRNGEVTDEELEDGEVNEDGDVNLALDRDAGGRARKSGTLGPQVQPTKSIAANIDKQEEEKASETDAAAETTETRGPGHDLILENIKMAYWWAGYYSGLFEGQQPVNRASTR